MVAAGRKSPVPPPEPASVAAAMNLANTRWWERPAEEVAAVRGQLRGVRKGPEMAVAGGLGLEAHPA